MPFAAAGLAQSPLFWSLGGGGVVDNGPSLYITMVVPTAAAADSTTPTSFQGQGNKGYTAAAAAKAQGHRVRVVHGAMPWSSTTLRTTSIM